MTEMLQKTENVAKNVANENSQDLTEQWRKGELPVGYYYVKDGENMVAEYLDGYFYNNGNPMTSFSGGVDSVLAPVPSYEEWVAAYECQLMESELVTTLKELLKECKDLIELMQAISGIKQIKFTVIDDFVKKINEVLDA